MTEFDGFETLAYPTGLSLIESEEPLEDDDEELDELDELELEDDDELEEEEPTAVLM